MLISPFFGLLNSTSKFMSELPDNGLQVEMLMFDSTIHPDPLLTQASIMY